MAIKNYPYISSIIRDVSVFTIEVSNNARNIGELTL